MEDGRRKRGNGQAGRERGREEMMMKVREEWRDEEGSKGGGNKQMKRAGCPRERSDEERGVKRGGRES